MKKILICAFLGFIIMISGCSNKEQKNQNNTSKTENKSPGAASTPSASDAKQQESSQSKTFTLEELKKYNGENGNPAYVAVDGLIYDVTNTKKWNNGKHEGVSAGTDLSKTINSSPHGKGILKETPVVGKLK